MPVSVRGLALSSVKHINGYRFYHLHPGRACAGWRLGRSFSYSWSASAFGRLVGETCPGLAANPRFHPVSRTAPQLPVLVPDPENGLGDQPCLQQPCFLSVTPWASAWAGRDAAAPVPLEALQGCPWLAASHAPRDSCVSSDCCVWPSLVATRAGGHRSPGPEVALHSLPSF